MQQSYKIVVFFFAVCIVAACTAPNDIDTPRKIHRSDGTVPRIAIQSVQVEFRPLSATLPLPYTCVWQRAEIDTANNSKLWLRGTCTAPANTAPSDGLPLQALTVQFEGLELSASSIPIHGDEGATKGTLLTIGSLIGNNEVDIIPDNNSTLFELQNIAHNRQLRHLSADVWIVVPVDGRALEIRGALDIRY